MENWNRRGKRWQESDLRALGALYGDDVSPPMPMPQPKPKDRPKRRERIPEQSIQMALVTWADEQGLPLIAIPNEGKRTPWAANRLKAMGLTPGVSDLFLAMPNPSHTRFGFWIELKSKGKKPQPAQWKWLFKMREYGYMAQYYDSFEDAKAAIEEYLS